MSPLLHVTLRGASRMSPAPPFTNYPQGTAWHAPNLPYFFCKFYRSLRVCELSPPVPHPSLVLTRTGLRGSAPPRRKPANALSRVILLQSSLSPENHQRLSRAVRNRLQASLCNLRP